MMKQRILVIFLAITLSFSMSITSVYADDSKEWYREYSDVSGLYCNEGLNNGFTIDYYHGMLSVTTFDYIYYDEFNCKEMFEQDGEYVYTSEEHGTELRYDPSNGMISIFEDSYFSLTRHGEQYELPKDFDVDWYKTPGYFAGIPGGEITISEASDGSMIIDGSYQCSMDVSSCEPTSFGGVYYTDYDEYELYYYSDYGEDGLLILMDNGWPSWYYKSDESSMNDSAYDWEEDAVTGNYLMETALGDTISTYVFAPYWTTDENHSYTRIRVLCQITNTSSDNLYFTASDYFTLNNNGIIEYGSSEYDYTTIAPWTTIQTYVNFTYRHSSVNIDYSLMTMTVDGVDVSLSLRPQSGDEYDAFPGAYCYNNGGDYFDYSCTWLYISDLGNGQYQYFKTKAFMNMAYYLNGMDYGQITLNADNTFYIDSLQYTWSPSEHTITFCYENSTYPIVLTKQ